MTITYHKEVIQGSDEWLQVRCGLLTASEMKLIITPTLKVASNDKSVAHVYELAAQRITGYVEPHYISDDMLRGMDDESYARETYHENYAPVDTCGFITNDKFGFTLGYSPDGLVGDDGLIECKSRRQKYQVETIVTNAVPDEHKIQIQTGLLVSERKWCDYVSYCGGLPMAVIRVEADAVVQEAIIAAAKTFYDKIDIVMIQFARLAANLIPTKRIEREMFT